jgi:hypothetical protein
MATMRPTPRNELLGLLSDAMAGGLEYMRDPQRTQQLQGLAGLLESTGIPKTTERLAYGEPLTNIGRANVPLLKPETAEAIMTVAPFAPKGMKMIRATEGMPVGMSIKDVGKTGLPSPQSLTMPSVPTVEQMKQYGRTETVPLSKAVSFQSARNWEKFNAGKGPGDLVPGYGDKPLALRLETGEYVIYDGNHRTDLALQKGKSELPMHVIDVKSYDPAHAGRKPAPSSMSDDELLNSLLGNDVQQVATPQQAALDLAQQRSSLLDMTRTPSEAEIKKMSREDLIDWLQNNDPDGQYMDPTPNPSISMYRTGKGYAVENADSGDVFEFKDFNEAQNEFNSMRFSNAEFQPMTLKEAQESAINYLRESAQPAESAKVLPFQRKGLLSP